VEFEKELVVAQIDDEVLLVFHNCSTICRKIEHDNIVIKKSHLQELISEMIGRNHFSMHQRGGHNETLANRPMTSNTSIAPKKKYL